MPIVPLASASWKFRQAPRGNWHPAKVPGCVHTDLQAAGLIPNPFHGTNELGVQWIEDRDWEYRAEFNVSAALLAEENVDLVADGLDTIATVTLNGRVVARTDNMFIGYRWSARKFLRAGQNTLGIRFRSALKYIRSTHADFTPPREFNDPVGNCVRIRKQQCQFGWDWGPRFVTAGIWRDIRLEAWSRNRLENVRITQVHRTVAGVAARDRARAANVSPGSTKPATVVELIFEPELARRDSRVTLTGTVSLNGRPIAEIINHKSLILNPALWWPAGQGAQPLYDVELTAHDRTARVLGTLRKRIGLRTIQLDRSPDQWGESFRFLVNHRPVFLKGANWIPAHSFVAGLTRRDYERDLRAAAAAHMNAIRVWGGGIYESEDFYDLCDELGLLVWQDFMFACTLYPADTGFLASVRTEVAQQAARLRHRASLALWCGNNELAMLNPALLEQPGLRRGYEKLFHQTIPAALAAHDPVTPYWPTSPWRGTLEAKNHQTG
ncbi:MAG TPA: glycoside hydrolase family 2 protein, partial [Lacunisphaera sp.]|nr:glycoside hydrolase family 2 protein [Lacunisphaera sp.]